ncbi:MAG: catechol 2,3-dioxygenase-like lactoylglutathione lyase family enzyme [Candidatus Paceibacteria bacterium]|jgi:catechol 2,3-dioxygenase-like lactoylglutathione lyase family enzyme
MKNTVKTAALTFLIGLASCASLPTQESAHPGFSSATIDFGMVVSDIEQSALFFTNTIGLREAPGFSVGAEFCTDAGLTLSQPLAIRVFQTGTGETATKLKLMQIPGATSKMSDNAFVHSQLGLSYITIYVTDMGAVLARLQATGVQPLAKGPVALGEDPMGPALILVRDPDGNLIELIGPTK